MYIDDILAGMVMIAALVLMVVGAVAYKRYHLKAMIMNFIVFLLFFINVIVYVCNELWNLNIGMTFVFLLVDTVILFVLYFAISLKG